MEELSPAQGMELARLAAEEGLDHKITSISPAVKQGNANTAYKVCASKGKYILRMQFNSSDVYPYKREKTASDLARKAGVPTPEIVALGLIENSHAYQLQIEVDGVRGTEYKGDIAKLWKQVGSAAKVINSIPVYGYLYDFDKDVESTWSVKRYIEVLGSDKPTNPLISKKVFTSETLLKTKESIEAMATWDFEPMLSHSDLSPGNFIIDDNNKVHIIDWGTVLGHIAPHQEVAQVMCYEQDSKNIDAFCEGYGLKSNFLKENAEMLNALQLARLSVTSAWICLRKPDMEEQIPWYRRKIESLLLF